MAENKFYVYILQNPKDRFYIGHTGDLDVRLDSHNFTELVLGKYTRKNGPWILVWFEEHSSRSSAMQREKQIKAMKSSKWIRDNLLNCGRFPINRD